MQQLRANTAVDVLIGPFVDEDDGKTAETGLTIAQADVRLSKNGQNIAQKNDVTAAAHDELGYHNCELDATDTNTEGSLVLAVHETGALPIRHEYMVLSEAAYDSLYAPKDTGFMEVGGTEIAALQTDLDTLTADTVAILDDTDGLQVDLDTLTAGVTLAADAITSAKIADNAFLAVNFAAGSLDSKGDWNTVTPDAAGVAPTAAEIETEVWDALQSAHVIADSMGAMATELALVPTTAMRGTDGVDTSAMRGTDSAATSAKQDTMETTLDAAATAASIAALNDLATSDLDAALVAIHLDHLLAADYDPASPPGTSTALFNELIESNAGVSRYTVGALENGPSGTGASAATIADAVWDELLSGHVGAGGFGKAVADIETDATAILADTNELQGDNVPGLIAALNDAPAAPTAAANADAVLDEALSGHVIAGSLGKSLADVETDATAILADTADIQPNYATEAKQDTQKSETVLILADTADMQPKVATLATDNAAGDLGVDVDKINGATLTGDGSATPFDVA